MRDLCSKSIAGNHVATTGAVGTTIAPNAQAGLKRRS